MRRPSSSAPRKSAASAKPSPASAARPSPSRISGGRDFPHLSRDREEAILATEDPGGSEEGVEGEAHRRGEREAAEVGELAPQGDRGESRAGERVGERRRRVVEEVLLDVELLERRRHAPAAQPVERAGDEVEDALLVRRREGDDAARCKAAARGAEQGDRLARVLDHVPTRDRVEVASLGVKIVELAVPHLEAEMLARVAGRLLAGVDPERLPAAPPRDGEEEAGAAADVEQAPGSAVALDLVDPALVALHQGIAGLVLVAVAVVGAELRHRAVARRVEAGEERARLLGAGRGPAVDERALAALEELDARDPVAEPGARARADRAGGARGAAHGPPASGPAPGAGPAMRRGSAKPPWARGERGQPERAGASR